MRINKMITKEIMPWSFIKFSQHILYGNVQRSVWRNCMWILGLKGLIQCISQDRFKWLLSTQNQWLQGAKKVTFTACHSGKLKLTFSSPNIISTSPRNVLMSRLISQFIRNLDSSKNFTCPSGKLITEFTSPIAKPTSPGLSDTTFFARWFEHF